MTEDILADESGIERLLISAYGDLDGFFGVLWKLKNTGSNWIYGDVYADNSHTGGYGLTDQPDIITLERYEHDGDEEVIEAKWKALYDGVAKSNHVIRVTNIALENKTITEKEAEQFIAEARFLRGYYHLEAIKTWDFVPYVDEIAFELLLSENKLQVGNQPPDKPEDNAGYTPWADLGGEGIIPWEKVEEDFSFAMENLPETPRNGALGRATKYAAIGILAKIKLFQGDFSKTLSLINEIIQSGQYSLLENYHENFRTIGDNKSEAIFQIQASVNDIAEGWVENGNLGDAGSGFPFGWGFNHPTQNLVNAFKTTDGTEGSAIPGLPFLPSFGLNFNEIDLINDDGLSASDPFTPDTRPLDPRLDWTIGRRGIPYLDWGIHPGRDWIRDPIFGPYSPIKHREHQDDESNYAFMWGIQATANNYSVLRYADVLLMAAECEVELSEGDLNRARDLVNQVRNRMADHPEYWVKSEEGELAANYLISLYPNGGSSDPFLTKEGAREAVRFERRLEMALEGHRFWDLKRWGIAKTTLDTYLEKESIKRTYLQGAIFKDHNIRHPIPNTEIDISQGMISQNPGY